MQALLVRRATGAPTASPDGMPAGVMRAPSKVTTARPNASADAIPTGVARTIHGKVLRVHLQPRYEPPSGLLDHIEPKLLQRDPMRRTGRRGMEHVKR